MSNESNTICGSGDLLSRNWTVHLNTMNRSHALRQLAVLLVAVTTALTTAVSRGDTLEETTNSAVFLLRTTTQVSQDGRHNLMLRALRQMRDPQLRPLFEKLSRSPHPALRIHGLLGLAECSEKRELDLLRFAEVDDAAVQAEVLSAAMDDNLLSDAQAAQLLQWPGLDNAVKVLAASHLVRRGKALADKSVLVEATKSELLARQALAHLLLLQTGEARSLDALIDLERSSDPKRDQVREMMLQTALRFEFNRAGPWALQVASERGISSKLSLLALRVAMHFEMRETIGIWTRLYRSDASTPQRMRLALIALYNAPQVDENITKVLLADDSESIQQIGKVTQAIATKTTATSHIIRLIELNLPLANSWALSYSHKEGPEEDAVRVLLSLILAANEGPARNRSQRIDDAIIASQYLYERTPDTAARILRPLLESEKINSELKQAILVGLIRTNEPSSSDVIAGKIDFIDATNNNIAALLQARYSKTLDDEQLQRLSLVVRGGGIHFTTLRVQAAWQYLKLTGQADKRLTEILSGAG